MERMANGDGIICAEVRGKRSVRNSVVDFRGC